MSSEQTLLEQGKCFVCIVQHQIDVISFNIYCAYIACVCSLSLPPLSFSVCMHGVVVRVYVCILTAVDYDQATMAQVERIQKEVHVYTCINRRGLVAS